ncbi:MAG: HEPN domain-containing protein [Phycisphaerales bacterium]|nr:MAG: HEPN domain-containing protein [Phycisphaerales bacterium]
MKPITEAWLAKASEDLDAIRVLRTSQKLSGVVAFHAQQCVEKCLKAVAEERLENVPRIHDLRRLWEIVSDQFQEALDVDLLRELTDVYTDSRYPGDLGLTPSGGPTEKDAVRFEQFAVHVHAKVLAVLS